MPCTQMDPNMQYTPLCLASLEMLNPLGRHPNWIMHHCPGHSNVSMHSTIPTISLEQRPMRSCHPLCLTSCRANVCPTDACPKELGTPTMNYGVAPTNKGIIAQGTREPRNIMFIIQATLRLLWETPNDNTHLATILTQIALPSYSMSCKNAQGMLVQTCNVSWKQTNAYQ